MFVFQIDRRPYRPLKPLLCFVKPANRQQNSAHAPLGDLKALRVADALGDRGGPFDLRYSPGVFAAINAHAREEQQNP